MFSNQCLWLLPRWVDPVRSIQKKTYASSNLSYIIIISVDVDELYLHLGHSATWTYLRSPPHASSVYKRREKLREKKNHPPLIKTTYLGMIHHSLTEPVMVLVLDESASAGRVITDNTHSTISYRNIPLTNPAAECYFSRSTAIASHH